MNPNLSYIKYLLRKPFHSYRYKSFKRESSSLSKKLNLRQKVLEEISEYTKEDFSRIEEKHKNLTAQVSKRDYDQLSDDEVLRFYSNDEHYFYELPIWNADCGRNLCISRIITPYLKRNKYKSILDFGAGTGDLCIVLAEEGFVVSYKDINKKLRDFSNWRFQKHGLNIKIMDESETGSGQFDCLVTFDVLEHLKNLPQKLKNISGFIKRKGSLIFNIESSGDGLHLKENKIYCNDRKLDKILRNAGFVFSWKFKRFLFYKKK